MWHRIFGILRTERFDLDIFLGYSLHLPVRLPKAASSRSYFESRALQSIQYFKETARHAVVFSSFALISFDVIFFHYVAPRPYLVETICLILAKFEC